jgi:CheY-like chemotaxis protein
MLQQVNNILDFNKIEADKIEIRPVSINLMQLLLNISMPFVALLHEKGLQLKMDISPGLDIPVMADELRLIQILNNLFSNALKFTEHGYVKLKVDLISKDAAHVHVGFTIEDTGVGIDPDDQKLIFKGFWQVQDENTKSLNGTGLGLNLTVRLLQMMNSQLDLKSEKGKGSEFSFELKLEHGRRELLNNTVGEDYDLNGVKILLAEDNPVNMMVAEKVLSDFNAVVTGAYNGREALTVMGKNPAFDVILLDLEMPVMNGYEAILEMKRLYPNIPVLAFTASLVDQNMLADLYASGFDDCILKPFQPHQLASVIKKHLSANFMITV